MKTDSPHGICLRFFLRLIVTAACLVSLLALPQRAVQAATVRYVKTDGSPITTCNSWVDACTLQHALSIASSGEEIWVEFGTYYPTSGTSQTATFELVDGVGIYGGFLGSENLRKDADPSANVTTLSGEIGSTGRTDDNSYHVVRSIADSSNTVLSGFTITAGYADGTSEYGEGAGLYINAGNPTLKHLIFSNNYASLSGGGLSLVAGSPSLSNVTFDTNTADNNGGGMFASTASNPVLTNVNFTHNSAANGGGMYNDGSSPSLSNVTFDTNTASNFGGGMDNESSSNPVLTNVTFTNNPAANAGGMGNSNSSPTLNNVTFSGNSATSMGGGMVNGSSSPTLTNVTLSGNSATRGGAIYNNNSSNPVIKDSILWGDSATSSDPEIRNWGSSVPVITYSDIQGGYAGTGNIAVNPLLGILGDYGDSTQVFPLLPGSAAIDAGDDDTCVSPDQRGVTRPQGSQCDMGAFESRGFTLSIAVGDYQNAMINSAFANPLSVSISSSYGDPVDGGRISFSVHSIGASAALSANTAMIISGDASVTATANAIFGCYQANASAAGASSSAIFHLCNIAEIYLPLIYKS